MAHKNAQGKPKKISIWCAAASRGQEIYSLAMYLSFHLPQIAPGYDFEIFGSDVDFESIKIAKNGVYRWDELKEAPTVYLSDHWQKGTGDIADYVKAGDSLKKKCSWGVVNLIDPELAGVKSGTFDIVFCRNVFIYFTPDQIEKISHKILSRLDSNGYFFVGLSESLLQINAPLKYVGPSIYTPKSAQPEPSSVAPVKSAQAPTTTPVPAPVPQVAKAPDVLKVLIVDDSPTVLSILKNILKKETGYEVVGTAKTGKEAADWMSKNKCDVMTLDLQMPEMGGIDYLKNYYNASHPPVLVVSSMSREDSEGGLKAIEYGAVDYVEKPTLQNLGEKSDEIRFKLRTAFLSRFRKDTLNFKPKNISTEFVKKTHVFDKVKTLRVVVGTVSDKDKIASILTELTDKDSPTLIVLDGQKNWVNSLEQEFKKSCRIVVESIDKHTVLDPMDSRVILATTDKTDLEKISKLGGVRAVSLGILGEPSKSLSRDFISGFKDCELIAEDLGDSITENTKALQLNAEHIVPFTSFVYHGSDFLAAKSGLNTGTKKS